MWLYLVAWSVIGVAFVISLVFCRCYSQAKWQTRDIYLSYIGTDRLGPYYGSVLNKLKDKGKKLDANGAVIVRNRDGKEWLSPISTAHMAFAYYERYLLEHRSEDKLAFLKVIDSLLASLVVQDDGTICWQYWLKYDKKQQVPWLSSMGQGEVIGVLARAYQETGDDKYLEVAKKALKVFDKDIEDGGVRFVDAKRGVFYEEYAFHEKNRQHHTLNGMMAALFCIHDLWKVSGSSDARRIFDTGAATIRSNLTAYHFPYCSSYDLRHEHGMPHWINPPYNAVHVAHLRILAKLTGDAYFEGVADIWNLTLKSRWNRFVSALKNMRVRIYTVTRQIRKFF